MTLNIPRIALETKGDMAAFWRLLDERMALVHDALVYRIERIRSVIPNNAPILYKSGAFHRRLTEDGNVMDLFTKQRATISIGYIGLYEAATVFYGPNWETNPEAKTFTLDILRRMKDFQYQWTEENDIFFSLYLSLIHI